MANRLSTVRSSKEDTVFIDGTLGRHSRFIVPDGKVECMYLKVVVNNPKTSSVPPEADDPMYYDVNPEVGYNIFKWIKLRSETGTLQTLDKLTLESRMDLINGSGLYNNLSPGVKGVQRGDDVIYFIPLFFYFSDLKGDYIDEKLYVEIKVCSGLNEIGWIYPAAPFPNREFVIKDLELFCRYPVLNTIGENLPRSVPYDSFPEHSLKVSAGASETRIILRCPFEVFYLHLKLLNPENVCNSYQITKLEVEVPDGTTVSMDRLMNYLLSEPELSFDESTTTSYRFGERNIKSSYVTFKDPLYVKASFAPQIFDRELRAVCEYHNEKSLNPDPPGLIYPFR